MAWARSNPESHAYFSLVNVIAMTLYMAVAMQIFHWVSAKSHVKCTVYCPGGAAFSAIESEIPAAATVVTVVNPEVSSKVDMKCSVRVFFDEIAMINLARISTVRLKPTAFFPVHMRRQYGCPTIAIGPW